MWADLGMVEYEDAMELQGGLREKTGIDHEPGFVLFVEHPPTITLGYSLKGDEGRSEVVTPERELEREGVRVAPVDRGGKATYHGPGQLVCYPVLSLKLLRLGVKRYVSKLESVVLAVLRSLGAPAELDPAYPGVWIDGAKAAAVGVRIKDRITTHGFALNLDVDLEGFRHIVPCGIKDRPVTSLAALGFETDRNRLRRMVIEEMGREMKIEFAEATDARIREYANGGART